jgi:curved DNA-binding protein CbpA
VLLTVEPMSGEQDRDGTASPTPNHYEILGVHVEASAETIKAAWRLKMKRHHPDTVHHLGDDVAREAAVKVAAMNEAWSVLRNHETRLRYDLMMRLRPARCARCGEQGWLRLGEQGSVVGLCDRCWERQQQ